MKIFWAYETKTTAPVIRTASGLARDPNGKAEVSVTRESATCGLDSTSPSLTIQIDEDHSSIVKFPPSDHRINIILQKLDEISGVMVDTHLDRPQRRLIQDGAENISPGFTNTFSVSDLSNRSRNLELPSTHDVWDARSSIEGIGSAPQRDDRLQQIEEKFEQTFNWIYEDPSVGFGTWFRSGQGIYWINGKPGSGKSTLMKFIYNDSRTKRILCRWGTSARFMTASFFFHHRGTLIQRSFEGLLRSIISQMIEAQPDLIPLLFPILEARLGQKLSAINLRQSLASELYEFGATYGGERSESLEEIVRDISDRQRSRFQLKRIFADFFAEVSPHEANRMEDLLLRNKWKLFRLGDREVNHFTSWLYNKIFTGEGMNFNTEMDDEQLSGTFPPEEPDAADNLLFLGLGTLVREWKASQDLEGQIRRRILGYNPILSKEAKRKLRGILTRQERRENAQREIESGEWDPNSLETILLTLLNQKLFDMDMCFFLDALDEYDGPKEFISGFLEDLVQRGPESRTRIRICFSSRPWQTFQDKFRNCPGFAIHEYTKLDIHNYCLGFITGTEHGGLSLFAMISEIVNRSRGIFLWVKLVLSDLKRASRYQNIGQLRDTLNALPSELDEYYSSIIERGALGSRWETFVILESILRARQPITIDDIFTIVECSYATTYEEGIKAMRMAELKTASMTQEAKEQKLQAITGGLAECITSSAVKIFETVPVTTSFRQTTAVQLMHQTANEFINDPQFKHTTLGDEGKGTGQNGHSFLSKFYFLSAKHFYNSLDPRNPDLDLTLTYHAREAEKTTGTSQFDFFSHAPQDLFGYAQFTSGGRYIKSVEGLAVYAGLDLFLRDCAARGTRRFSNCEPQLARVVLSQLDGRVQLQNDSRKKVADRLLLLAQNGLNISKDRRSFHRLIAEMWGQPFDGTGSSDDNHRQVQDVFTTILVMILDTGKPEDVMPLLDSVVSTTYAVGELIHFSPPKLAKCALRYGAKPNAGTRKNETAMDFALSTASPHQQLPLREIHELMQILAQGGGLLRTTKLRVWESFIESCKQEGLDVGLFERLEFPNWMSSRTIHAEKAKRLGGRVLHFLGRR
ncbi:hypothetical protein PT974_05437 [Cladobotryum mycophilum]|uniref:Nephrocystin 3-like N-terminal domain-containing protein n=1 Tax=Cladobotryum mycophilum TaxID=491253 RepID=A0ABR0SJM4_9HYPO